MTLIAFLFSGLCLVVIVFQFALVLGAPWGEYTMGGEIKGVLPPNRRAAAVIQILILILFALVALTRAGLILPGLYGFSRVAIWVIAAFFVFGSFTNWTSKSKKERYLWGPVNVLMLASSLILALSE
jgi:hypothetical protein